MEKGDDWLAVDKLEHIIFCFTISVAFSLLLSRTLPPSLRRRHVLIGSFFSASAGASKEIADELGFFGSSGASAKDAAADILGIFFAALLLKYLEPLVFRVRVDRSGQGLGVEIV